MKMINGDTLGKLFDKRNTLNDMPAVEDTIVVTRCKDCKYSEFVDSYFCNVCGVSINGYGFCHWAEQEFV